MTFVQQCTTGTVALQFTYTTIKTIHLNFHAHIVYSNSHYQKIDWSEMEKKRDIVWTITIFQGHPLAFAWWDVKCIKRTSNMFQYFQLSSNMDQCLQLSTLGGKYKVAIVQI